jgi:poly(A) polymerase
VRMLRAVRFAAKLDFTIDASVVKSMHKHVELLSNVPAARLFDEFLKLFQSGFAERTFDLLREHGLFAQMFPATDEELEADPSYEEFVRAALRNTDRRVAQDKSVTPMFLIGVFFWAPTVRLAEILRSEEKISESQALSLASYELMAQQQKRISIPKRFSIPMREMLSLQPRFTNQRGKRALKFLEHKRFRAAYDFMVLLSEVGKVDKELAEFWTNVQTQSAEERAKSFQMGAPAAKKRNRRRRKKKGPAATSSS